MLPKKERLKMARQADAVYDKNYVPLTQEYLDNVPAHANLEDVRNGKCSMENAHSISNYSGNISRALNGAIRSGYLDSTVKLKLFEASLTAGLLSLPAFDDQIVYRMEKYGPELAVYEKYFIRQNGNVLNMPCFLSTSSEDWNCTKVVYQIKTLKENSKARDISRITNKADETETLFCKGANFLITGLVKTDDKLIIVMEETKDPAVAVLNYYDDPDATDLDDTEEPGLFD